MKRGRVLPASASVKKAVLPEDGDKEAPMLTVGVSLAFLKTMKDIVKSSTSPGDQPTIDDVIEKFIKPWTEGAPISLAEHFKRKYSLDLHPVLKASFYSEYFAEATVFVSYARKYTFEGLVDALEHFAISRLHAAQHGLDDEDLDNENSAAGTPSIKILAEKKLYFWIDILNVNQYVAFPDNKITMETFTKLIGKIGETCLVAMPWNNPLPFKRTWCLFELLATQMSGAALSIQLSKTRHPKYLEELADNYEVALSNLSVNIDVESSETSNEREKVILLDIFIRLEDGCHHANSVITDSIKKNAFHTAVRQIRAKLKREKELRMAEKVEKQRTISLRELFCLTFGCTSQPQDLTVFDPKERADANRHALSAMKLRLAALMGELQRLDESEALYKEVLAENEGHYGPDHPTMLSILGNLAFLYKTQRRLEESEQLFGRVLAAKERVLGPAHPSTLVTMQNLASLHKDCERHDQAMELFRRSLSEQQHQLGENHPDTLLSMEHLAHLYLDCGHNQDAKEQLVRLLALKEELYGDRHKETAATCETLAALYVKEDMFAEALPLFRKTLVAREALFGPTHPSTIATCLRLATVQKKLRGDEALAEAEVLYFRVLAVTEKNFGARHVGCFVIIEHIVDVRVMAGNLEGAEQLLKELLDKKEDLLGVKAPSTLATKYYLGDVCCKLKKYALAETYHRSVLGFRSEVLGAEHPDTAASLHGLATCLVHVHKVDEGKGLYERALALFDRLDGPASPRALSSADCLATVCKVTGDVGQAEDLLNRLKAHYRAVYGPNHPVTIGYAKRLASVIQAQ
jgi:tetratricopeptide (TPR) repeat protein